MLVNLTLGDREFFPGIGRIRYEGPDTDNPLAFRYYDEHRLVAGKPLRDHFRFALAYWHTICGTGIDPFGAPTKVWPWLQASDPLRRARDKMDAALELATKLGLPFFCFHDFDLVEEAPTLAESERRLWKIAEYAKDKMAASGVRVLWGTANLFAHPRYMNGAATNPDFAVVAHAGAQVKIAIDLTIALDGQGYVFWGGREGYLSLLNTDMKRERDHLARFLSAARDYARAQGFKGILLIEPKPMEPSKHQYDFDAATTIGFLREYGLEKDFKLNIEANHATLAQHTFAHELQVAADANLLGSIDANRGDYQNGWDTDQFPSYGPELIEAMLVLLQSEGLQGGGINFDAKTRRNSTDGADLFYAHIGAMDAFARALLAAQAVLERTPYLDSRRQRYASFDSGEGLRFAQGELGLEDLYRIARRDGEPLLRSGRQEWWENWVYRYA